MVICHVRGCACTSAFAGVGVIVCVHTPAFAGVGVTVCVRTPAFAGLSIIVCVPTPAFAFVVIIVFFFIFKLLNCQGRRRIYFLGDCVFEHLVVIIIDGDYHRIIHFGFC